LGAGIQSRLAVHQELILVVAVIHLDLGEPRAIGLPAHGIRLGAPLVELADHADLLCAGRQANEIDRFGHFLGGVELVGSGERRLRLEHLVQLFFVSVI